MSERMTKTKNFVNEILIYDTKANIFTMKYPEHEPIRHLSGRRDYASFKMGNYFYFHGGIDSNDQSINEFVKINLDTLIWEDVNLTKMDDTPI